MTEPLPTEPLLTQSRLSLWAQERPLLDPEFADLVLDAVSTLLRQHGDPTWEAATVPARARDIGYVVAKDYYLNPGLLRSETTGPITETRAEAVLRGLELSDVQIAELQQLAGANPGAEVDGLWSFGFTRDDSMIHKNTRPRNVVIFDTRETYGIEYLHEDEAIVFWPEETV